MKRDILNKGMIRRATSALLMMLLTATAAWADDSGNFGTMSGDTPGNNTAWSYDSSSKTLTISGMGALAEYSGTTVTRNSTDNRPFAAYKNDCEYIVINEGITSIGERDFAYMNSVSNVSIPASVTLTSMSPRRAAARWR